MRCAVAGEGRHTADLQVAEPTDLADPTTPCGPRERHDQHQRIRSRQAAACGGQGRMNHKRRARGQNGARAARERHIACARRVSARHRRASNAGRGTERRASPGKGRAPGGAQRRARCGVQGKEGCEEAARGARRLARDGGASIARNRRGHLPGRRADKHTRTEAHARRRGAAFGRTRAPMSSRDEVLPPEVGRTTWRARPARGPR